MNNTEELTWLEEIVLGLLLVIATAVLALPLAVLWCVVSVIKIFRRR